MKDWTLADDAPTEEMPDYALPPFGDLVAALADMDDPDDYDGDPLAAARAGIVEIERIALALSVEVDVVPDGYGGLAVRGSTPTQYTETTVMPLFHHLTLHVGLDPDHEPHGEG
ncbi:MAG: hypothetical protein ABI910_10600 [Gemmatimonadota bacterium]